MKKMFLICAAALFMFVACGDDPVSYSGGSSQLKDQPCELEGAYKCDNEGTIVLQCTQQLVWAEIEKCGVGTTCNREEGKCKESAAGQACETENQFKCDNNNVLECKEQKWEVKEYCDEKHCNETTGVCDAESADTADTDTNTPADTAAPADDCAQTEGQNCATDNECGACMICVTGGKCAKGCKTDEDCTTVAGTKCNKALARCTNTYASNSACNETNCPTGCCYAEKGLTAVKCATEANPSVCGLCPNGEIYSPTDSKCISAVCSSTTDNCPSINSASTNPPAKCFECKQGELVCTAKTTTSGCSAGTVINAAQCVPAGQQCVEGISECCSGMPCVQGYCY